MILKENIPFRVLIFSLSIFLWVTACDDPGPNDEPPSASWLHRPVTASVPDSSQSARSYLSVYSHIYRVSEHRTHNLTATVSVRNTSDTERIYLNRADYYNTHGKLLRKYLDAPTYLDPMETVSLVIERDDQHGGSGANFLFDWAAPIGATEPLFEAVMISTSGSQGISFTTHGVRVK